MVARFSWAIAQARLRAAKLHVALRHIGEHGDQHRAVILDRDLHAPRRRPPPNGVRARTDRFPRRRRAAQLQLIVGIRNGEARAARHVDGSDRIEKRAGGRRLAEALAGS